MSAGIDFGTTNSVAALARANGGVTIAHHGADLSTANFRSVLCFFRAGGARASELVIKTGPEAMAAYLEHGSDCRLIQSVKSLAANPNFTSTHIFGHKFTVEDLMALIIQGLRSSAERHLPDLGDTVTAGRPVRFVGHFANEELAINRLGQAFAIAGFPNVTFIAEPLAAAYKFASRIAEPQTCVVADFGGGTSDFSLVRFVPGADGLTMQTLATSGVGLAGDRLDYRIIEKAVCPRLGLGSHYISMGKRLEMPVHYYARFQRWSDLSFLRTPAILTELRALKRMSETPEAISWLLYIIEEELGFELHRAVSAVKAALSSQETAVLEFKDGPVEIRRSIARAEFNTWIAEDLARIDAEVTKLFEESGLFGDEVGHVFMTGGTSFVPAIREMMHARFPAAKFSAEDEFVSVGAGLALFASEMGELSPEPAAPVI